MKLSNINIKNILAGIGVCFILAIAGFIGLQTAAQFFKSSIVEDGIGGFLKTVPNGAYIVEDDLGGFSALISGEYGVIIVEDDLVPWLRSKGVKFIVEDDLSGFLKKNPDNKFTFIVEDDLNGFLKTANKKVFIVEDDINGFDALVGKKGFIVEDDLHGFLKELKAKIIRKVQGQGFIVEDDLRGF